MTRILVLEPYFGGSHRHFLDGLQGHVAADYTLLVLPARKWKMRMQLAAPWFVQQIKELPPGQRGFDLVLCSSFLDVAVFRSLVSGVKYWNSRVKVLTYFHENQFAYPLHFQDRPDYQFAAVNFNSALCSDGIAFNSKYNRDTFTNGCSTYLKRAADIPLGTLVQSLLEKSVILSPGIDFGTIDEAVENRTDRDGPPVVVWNHRWEHDKNPELFFDALAFLKARRLDFRLLILGQSFTSSPRCFVSAHELFSDRIIHSGFVSPYREYAALLARGDMVVSTANHEFYGIAVIEAVRAGCTPVLPDTLSYPELFSNRYLYRKEKFLEEIAGRVENYRPLAVEECRAMTDRFSWKSMRGLFADWFARHCG